MLPVTTRHERGRSLLTFESRTDEMGKEISVLEHLKKIVQRVRLIGEKMDAKTEQHTTIEFCYRLGKSAAVAYDLMRQAHKNDCFHLTTGANSETRNQVTGYSSQLPYFNPVATF